MSNPFDKTDGSFRVLVNQEGRHSLWPDFIDIPQGWSTVRGPSSRQECIEYIDKNWTDIRPRVITS